MQNLFVPKAALLYIMLLVSTIGFPCFVKPIDGVSSNIVKMLQNIENVSAWKDLVGQGTEKKLYKPSVCDRRICKRRQISC